MCINLLETLDTLDANKLLVDLEEVILVKFGKGTAHRFKLEAEVTTDFGEYPRALKRCDKLSRNAAMRSSARITPNSIMTPLSRTISRLMIL